jgi:glycosyltransferase involved in cell wall biosynthesis
MPQLNKVCHLLSSLKIGGAERFCIDLSLEQQKMGYEVTIISFGSTNDELYNVAVKENINVIIFNKKWWTRNITLCSILKKFNILHLHSPVILKVILLTLPLLTKQEIIYTRHGEGLYQEFIWKLTHKLAKPFISAVTFVSQNGQRVFNKIHRWSNIQQQVIENGISVSDLKIVKTNSPILRIGSVGRMVPLKSQRDLIQAWANLPENIKSNIELHLIGDGECRQLLEKQVLALGAQKSIFFHGFLNDRFKILALFDLLVVSSESEGLSIAILEAMAQQKPVIATNVGGNPRLIQNNLTGVLYEYGDIKHLTSAILDYYQKPETLNQHGINAQTHVKTNYSLNKTAREYDGLYQ